MNQFKSIKLISSVGVLGLGIWLGVGHGVALAQAFVKSGNVDEFTFNNASVSSFEPDLHAGADATLLAQIGGLGDVIVNFSAPWDWNAYEGTDHPCALVEKDSHMFDYDVIDGANFWLQWTSTATVSITHRSGAVIDANITGGSVCEVAVPGSGGTGSVNEWNINFQISGGSNQFAGLQGTGTIHFFYDSGNFTFGISEVLVHLN